MVRVAEYGLRQPFCGFVCLLWSNAAESLWPKTSVSKDAVCFGFVSSDRGWAAAVLTLGAWPKSKSAGRGASSKGRYQLAARAKTTEQGWSVHHARAGVASPSVRHWSGHANGRSMRRLRP